MRLALFILSVIIGAALVIAMSGCVDGERYSGPQCLHVYSSWHATAPGESALIADSTRWERC